MIFFDSTKSMSAGHRSGLLRVSSRLLGEFGAAATPVSWEKWDRSAGSDDWFFTAELFSEPERPGFTDFLLHRKCRAAAVFHDMIPIRHPQMTWPQSVARHPEYVKLLSRFDRVWAVSATVRDDLLRFWRWQGVEQPPRVELLASGADFDGTPRRDAPPSASKREHGLAAGPPLLLSVGIVEPRKNQTLLLDVCDALWSEGRSFELHLVGRANPHFGRPIVRRIRELGRKRSGLHWHSAASDSELAALYDRARASLFPTIAEGCGLPLLESLWRGVPCVCSDLPVLLENARGGGCLPVAANDSAAWTASLKRILDDAAFVNGLAAQAASRPLPTWSAAAGSILRVLDPAFQGD